jgi:hypothetical protein
MLAGIGLREREWVSCGGAGRQNGLLEVVQMRLGVGFNLQIPDLFVQLRLELIAGPLEFGEDPSDLSSDLRQFLGPEEEQAKYDQKRHFRKSKVLREECLLLGETHFTGFRFEAEFW